jgi:Dynamitin
MASSIDHLAQETKTADPTAVKPSRSDESSRIAIVEAALAKLQEKLPVLEAQLDVDGLQKKAKVIRQDLEAAAKARTKLQQHHGGGNSEDTKRIAALYDQLQSLQGVSHCLPVLAERLETLAISHSQAASHQVRVRAMEQTVGQLQGQMLSIEATLAALEASMKENAAALQASISSLSK